MSLCRSNGLPLTPSIAQLHATKKEIIDNDALIERYRKEIEDLKRKLAERDEERPVAKLGRRPSAREVSYPPLTFMPDPDPLCRRRTSRVTNLTYLID